MSSPRDKSDTTAARAELEHLLARGRLSRREFLGRATALGITAAAATSLWSSSALAAPKKGGRLRAGLGHGSTTDSLDPATYENGYMTSLGYTKNNHLTEVGPNGDLIPELCEGWDASPDAKTWTFELRKGVEFHNGKTMDADDVLASFQHHMGETKSPAKSLLEQVVEMKKDGPSTVVFTLKAGNADFPFIASDYHVAIQPPGKDGGLDFEQGTGGYVLEEWEPGVRSLFTRNPNYWKDGAAHFDEIEMLAIIDVNARTNALKTGEIDTMDRCDLKTVHLLKRAKGLKVAGTTGTRHYTFPMRTDIAPFDNNDVRLALKYALNRKELLDKVLRGHGVLGNDHPIAPSNRYHAGNLPQREFDPDKAKFHAKKSGLGNLSVDLSAADAAFGGALDAAVLYKEHAAKAGININVVREPNDGYWSNVWMKKAWCACYWGGRPTEDWMFSTAYSGDASWNDTFWKHDEFNKLLLTARAELDETKRRALYEEMQGIVSNEGGVVVPMFANYVFAMKKNVQRDGKMQGNWDMDGLKFAERWYYG